MTTTIVPADRADAKALAQRLLEAAGAQRHDQVQTVTEGPLALAFEVPDDLANQVLGTGNTVEGRSARRDSADSGAAAPAAAATRQSGKDSDDSSGSSPSSKRARTA